MSRLRDLGFPIGLLPTGTTNSITDVPGVRVGHATVIRDVPTAVRTGVTVIMPPTLDDGYYAGRFNLNGNGEMTGVHWLDESGLLVGPIGLTNTHQVGLVRDALVRHEMPPSPTHTTDPSPKAASAVGRE
ncbi:MAG TPA: P1 family peptidase [Ilumatobacteraceae bacterium]